MKETVEIGYVFNPQFHHNGYAKESVRAVIEELFKTFKIHRIQTNLDARNLPSAKLCESVGMRNSFKTIGTKVNGQTVSCME